MTKGWWANEPGQQVLNAISRSVVDGDAGDQDGPKRLPVTWWTVAIVVIVLLAAVGLGVYLIADTVNSCRNAAAQACEPTR